MDKQCPGANIRVQPLVVPGHLTSQRAGKMSFLIGRYTFEGPMINWRGVRPEAGIYAILSFANNEFELIDIAETSNLQKELLKPEKQLYWQARSNGMLTFSVHYHPRASRGRR